VAYIGPRPSSHTVSSRLVSHRQAKAEAELTFRPDTRISFASFKAATAAAAAQAKREQKAAAAAVGGKGAKAMVVRRAAVAAAAVAPGKKKGSGSHAGSAVTRAPPSVQPAAAPVPVAAPVVPTPAPAPAPLHRVPSISDWDDEEEDGGTSTAVPTPQPTPSRRLVPPGMSPRPRATPLRPDPAAPAPLDVAHVAAGAGPGGRPLDAFFPAPVQPPPPPGPADEHVSV